MLRLIRRSSNVDRRVHVESTIADFRLDLPCSSRLLDEHLVVEFFRHGDPFLDAVSCDHDRLLLENLLVIQILTPHDRVEDFLPALHSRRIWQYLFGILSGLCVLTFPKRRFKPGKTW